METTTQAEPTVCVMCHGPNPTNDRTCSRDCEIDLAFELGRITDYPEEDTMDTQADQITVYYEPAHDVNTARTVIEVLAARGYTLDSDCSTLRYSPVLKTKVLYPYPDLSVEIHDGRLQLCTVVDETDLKPAEQFETPQEYATALADAFDANRKARR